MKKLFYICFLFSFYPSIVGANTSELEKIFQANDTIYNHSEAVEFLLYNFRKFKKLSQADSLNFEQRIAHRFIYLQKLDSSLIFINRGLHKSKTLTIDSVTVYLLKLKGNVYYYMGQKDNALKEFEEAIEISKKNKFQEHLANVYSNVGTIKLEQKKYLSAENYLSESIKIFDSLNLSQSSSSLLAKRLLGTYYYENKKYKEALQIFNNLTETSKKLNIPEIQSSAQTYKAITLAKLGRNAEAQKEFDEVIDIQKKVNLKDTEAAVLMKYVEFLKSNKNFEVAIKNLERVLDLKKELFEKELAASYSDAEIKYETQKKEAEIQIQKKIIENEKKEKTLYTSLLTLGLALLSVLIIFIRNKHKHKTELLLKEQQEIALSKVLEAEEKERIRIAKDLHDGIVQDITAIKLNLNEIIHQATDDVKSKLDNINKELDSTSKEVREISYQLMPVTLKELGLEKALEELLNKILPKSNISFDFQSLGLETRLPEKIEVNVYRICQELLNNSLKHSKATHISILLQLKNNTLQLTYEDNGVGFDANNVKKGIGLNSLNSRIEMIKGSLDFDNEQTKGITAYIKIPI